MVGAVDFRWEVRSDLHVCCEKGGVFLITHISIVSSILIEGPDRIRGLR